MKILLIFIFSLSISFIHSQERKTEKPKKPYYPGSVLRLKIGEKHGTGFLIEDSLLVTNYHVVKDVVESMRNNQENPEKIICTKAQNLEILFDDVNFNYEAKVFKDYIDNDSIYMYSVLTDIIILDVKDGQGLSRPFTLSDFNHFIPGDEVFTYGFPLSDRRSSISKGLVGFMNSDNVPPPYRDFAKLNSYTTYQTDLRTTKGGSGSPVIVRGKDGEIDKVVGILSSGVSANAEMVEKLREKYKLKVDSLKSIKSNFKTKSEKDILEKAIIFDTLLNDVATIAIFIDSRHIIALRDRLNLEDR